MSYCHYTFTADIWTRNMSQREYHELRDYCRELFFQEQKQRRSTKSWTSCKVTRLVPSDPSSFNNLIRFEIFDANSVKCLKSIAWRLQDKCAVDFKRFVTNMESRHVRTK